MPFWSLDAELQDINEGIVGEKLAEPQSITVFISTSDELVKEQVGERLGAWMGDMGSEVKVRLEDLVDGKTWFKTAIKDSKHDDYKRSHANIKQLLATALGCVLLVGCQQLEALVHWAKYSRAPGTNGTYTDITVDAAGNYKEIPRPLDSLVAETFVSSKHMTTSVSCFKIGTLPQLFFVGANLGWLCNMEGFDYSEAWVISALVIVPCAG